MFPNIKRESYVVKISGYFFIETLGAAGREDRRARLWSLCKVRLTPPAARPPGVAVGRVQTLRAASKDPGLGEERATMGLGKHLRAGPPATLTRGCGGRQA